MRTVWVATTAGWLVAAVVVSLSYPEMGPGAAVLLGVLVIAFVCLATLTEFPRRREGLVSSGIGATMLAVFGHLVARGLVLEGGGARSAPPGHVTLWFLLVGILNTGIMVWLLRGFGLVPFMAMAACVVRGRAEEVRTLARRYPWPLWWLVPAVTLGMGLAITSLVYLGMRWAVGLVPDPADLAP